MTFVKARTTFVTQAPHDASMRSFDRDRRRGTRVVGMNRYRDAVLVLRRTTRAVMHSIDIEAE